MIEYTKGIDQFLTQLLLKYEYCFLQFECFLQNKSRINIMVSQMYVKCIIYLSNDHEGNRTRLKCNTFKVDGRVGVFPQSSLLLPRFPICL